MLEMLMQRPPAAKKRLVFKYSFEVPQIPADRYVSGLGQSESGELILHAPNYPISVVYEKDASGKFILNKAESNTGNVGLYAVPIAGGFVVSTPRWPNDRGSLSVWQKQPDGRNIIVEQPKDDGGTNGGLGNYGGLASIPGWVFSGVNYGGSSLVCFAYEGGSWKFKNYISKTGDTYFASTCIRGITDTEIIVSSDKESYSGKSYAGAVYVVSVATGTAVEKQRIVPSDPQASGEFGTNIVVINDNRFVVTAKSGLTSYFYTFERPDSLSPFVETYKLVLPSASLVGVNNIAYGKGIIICSNASIDSATGMISLVEVMEDGKLIHLPNENIKGKSQGEWFGSTQTVIGDQVFVLSQWRTTNTKFSVINVYDIT